jgi:hypothetical protein
MFLGSDGKNVWPVDLFGKQLGAQACDGYCQGLCPWFDKFITNPDVVNAIIRSGAKVGWDCFSKLFDQMLNASAAMYANPFSTSLVESQSRWDETVGAETAKFVCAVAPKDGFGTAIVPNCVSDGGFDAEEVFPSQPAASFPDLKDRVENCARECAQRSFNAFSSMALE